MNKFKKYFLDLIPFAFLVSVGGSPACDRVGGGLDGAGGGPTIVRVVAGKSGFEPSTIRVERGRKVKLSFSNATSGSESDHNLVIAVPHSGVDVANAGAAAGAVHSYVPVDSRQVLASTRLLHPGESETIEITLPDAPGDYPFLCTVPGHFEKMHGVLEVK